MIFINSSKKIEKTFSKLLDNYSAYYCNVAWAGIGFKAFEQLKEKKQNIKQITVGLKFYQTHPEFINEFMNCDEVNY